jgi:hypothetical protein
VDVRRVVTGHDAQGKAVFVSDQQVAPITAALIPGVEFHRLWGADVPPRFPDDGSMPAPGTYFPPVGGFRFAFFTLPPGKSAIRPAAPTLPSVYRNSRRSCLAWCNTWNPTLRACTRRPQSILKLCSPAK